MHKTIIAALGLSSSLVAAQSQCEPQQGAPCYADDCKTCYCLGPAETIANAPVCPHTCDGDFSIAVAGLYWTAHQDGLEFAIDDGVYNGIPDPIPNGSNATVYVIPNRNFSTLIDASYLSPKAKWDYGFKLSASYCSPCDGWDVGVNWTWYQGSASLKAEAETEDNHILLPIWTGFTSLPGRIPYAFEIQSDWNLDLNLVDLELGRDFWTSRYLSIRPMIGLRFASIKQHMILEHRGGYWGEFPLLTQVPFPGSFEQSALNNQVDLNSTFRGVGILAGLSSTWNMGCGWGLYGNVATAIVYGKFHVDHSEMNRRAEDPYRKSKVLETEESINGARTMLDCGLGVQWMGMICDCKYGLEIALGWESHLFFNQNQFFRISRVGSVGSFSSPLSSTTINSTGVNNFSQRRGNLDTQGVTLKAKFDF